MKEITDVAKAKRVLDLKPSDTLTRRADGLFEFRFNRQRDTRQTVDTFTSRFIDTAQRNGCICGIAEATYESVNTPGDQALVVIRFTLEDKQKVARPGKLDEADAARAESQESFVKALPKLFHQTKREVYSEAMSRLESMRQAHPQYRDDELLMRLLCDIIDARQNEGT
jgi:hypothetical protein